MAQPVTRSRRSASKILVLLVILAAIGGGLWWKFVYVPNDLSITPELPPVIPLARFEEKRPLMGTEASIVVFAPNQETATKAITTAFQRGDQIHAICSDYDPASELSKLNASPIGTPVPLSPTLATVLAHARETADITSGAFDPALGTLSSLWRESRESGSLPDPAALATAREASGWEHLDVDLANSTATLHAPGMKLDLGGIAKGYAADEMLLALKHHGLTRALIVIGGDVRLGDPPPDAIAWRVGLRTLSASTHESIAVANCAVSTSGDLHQFVDINGIRYAHIIDPATGLGLTRRTAATIIAPTAIQSDPYATFACINPEAALQAFIGGEIRCRIVSLDGPNFKDDRSPNFPTIGSF